MAAQAPAVASSSSPLESLPLLVLGSVCEYLATIDSRRRSLFAFSMTSTFCRAIADRERFKWVQLAVREGDQLKQVLERWDDILRVGQRSSYVRSVKITGSIDSENWIELPRSRVTEFQENNMGSDDEDVHFEEDPISRPLSLSKFVGSRPVCTVESKATYNRLWQPLAHFLSKCYGLRDFIWHSTDQVPRCILDVLHQLPHSLLHINTFSLRSLYQRIDQLHDIDLDEYALATSPRLSSIYVAVRRVDETGHLEYNEDAALEMTLGLAPNLRSVYVGHKIVTGTSRIQQVRLSQRPPWPGFFANGQPQKSVGHLRTLALRGDGLAIPNKLQIWSRHTDFTMLHSLHLDLLANENTLRELNNMAEAGVFKCLRMLALNIFRPQEFKDVTIKFISALQPLETLSIRGRINDAVLLSILDHHSTSLKRLFLPGWFVNEYIKDLHKRCQNLRELHLSIRRTHGNKQEVSLYQALGRFPRLEKLTLRLDCEDRDIGEAAVAEGEEESQIQRMSSALINSAIDANLARSIFLAILESNRTVQPDIIPSFQYLKLYCFCGWGGFEQLQYWVGRSWICERKRADIHSDEVIVQEDRVWNTIGHRRSRKRDVDQIFNTWYGSELFRPAWEAVWPQAKGMSNWIDEWHSFELYSSHSKKG